MASTVAGDSLKTKHDFTQRQSNVSKTFTGVLEKKSFANGAWKKRLCHVADGLLKFFEEEPERNPDDLSGRRVKGQISLRGAEVLLSQLTHITLTCAVDGKHTIFLRAFSAQDAREWNRALSTEIERANIAVLRANLRMDEVRSWYYRTRGEILLHNRILLTEIQADFVYKDVYRKGMLKRSPCYLRLSDDLSELIVRIEEKTKYLDPEEEFLNSQPIKLKDMLGAKTDKALTSSGVFFAVKFITRDKSILFETVARGGPEWFTKFQDVATFAHIPKPLDPETEESQAPVLATLLSEKIIEEEFKIMSESNNPDDPGSIPTVTIDMLRQMRREPFFKLVVISELAKSFRDVLLLTRKVVCNQAVASRFRKRLENFIDIMYQCLKGTSNTDSSSILFYLQELKERITRASSFLTKQCEPGWLVASMTEESNPCSEYERYDTEIASLITHICASLGKSGGADAEGTSPKPSYESEVIDVQSAVLILGSVEAIYLDPRKQSLLSKSLQVDQSTLMEEITRVYNLERRTREREMLEASGQEDSPRIPKKTFLQRVCPCFCSRSKSTTEAVMQTTLLPLDQNAGTRGNVKTAQKLNGR